METVAMDHFVYIWCQYSLCIFLSKDFLLIRLTFVIVTVSHLIGYFVISNWIYWLKELVIKHILHITSVQLFVQKIHKFSILVNNFVSMQYQGDVELFMYLFRVFKLQRIFLNFIFSFLKENKHVAEIPNKKMPSLLQEKGFYYILMRTLPWRFNHFWGSMKLPQQLKGSAFIFSFLLQNINLQ